MLDSFFLIYGNLHEGHEMMKRISVLVVLGCILLAGSIASAGVSTFTMKDGMQQNSTLPGDHGLNHYRYYAWDIDWELPDGEVLISASLKFTNIYNWDQFETNILHVNLLDNAPSLPSVAPAPDQRADLHYGYDNQGGGNFWSNYYTAYDETLDAAGNLIPGSQSGGQILIGNWSDGDGPVSKDNVIMLFSDEQLRALEFFSDAHTLFVGLDPDCHFYMDQMELEIVTGGPPGAPVPEPATMLLFGMGLIFGAGLTRKKMQVKKA